MYLVATFFPSFSHLFFFFFSIDYVFNSEQVIFFIYASISLIIKCEIVRHLLLVFFVCVKHFSRVQICAALWTEAHQWSGLHTLLQVIFSTQGSNPHLLCLLLWEVGSATSATWEAPAVLWIYAFLFSFLFSLSFSHLIFYSSHLFTS